MTDRFDEVFKGLGGRSPGTVDKLKWYLKRGQEIANQVLQRAGTRATALPIEFGLIDNPFMGARSTIDGGTAFVGVFDGALVLLDSVFSRLFSHRKCFPLIGNPAVERDDVSFPYRLTADALEWINDLGTELAVLPNDPKRRAIAAYLSVQAFDLVVLHEIAHVMNGHILLKRERALKHKDADGNGVNLEQTLEMDADTFAVNALLRSEIESLVKDGSAENEARAVEQIAIKMIAVYWPMRFFGFCADNPEGSHPGPGIRRKMFLIIAASNIMNGLGEKRGGRIVEGSVVSAMTTSEEAIAAISGAEIPREIGATLTEQAADRPRQICEKWKLIYPDLRRLAFTDNLIPPQDWDMKVPP